MCRRAALLFCTAVLITGTWALADRLEDTLYIPLDHPAIQYAQPPDDAIAHLEKRIENGEVKLDYAANGQGYLPAVLKQLGIHTDSQILVFSKTSIQTSHIGPRTPRAIYFNDTVAVGFVQNGDVLEMTSLDPKRGVIFYTLDNEKVEQPVISRRDDCLRCHQGPVTLAVPGLLISSVHPRSADAPEPHGSAFMTDDRTPFNERWGGWYVTGTHGSQYHLGNNVALEDPIHPGPPKREGTQNITSLAQFFNTSRYPTDTSDLVALMTLEHQTRMTNLMTRIAWDSRIAVHDQKMDAATQKQMDAEIDEMVAYMLFADEEPLRDPVAGVSTFTKTFAQLGPRDHQGRSLRDFDLKKRLFRYPLSYMIYSQAFDGIPDVARERVYRRIYDVLSGKDTSETFAKLSPEDRRSVLEIVRDTKTNLPSYWK